MITRELYFKGRDRRYSSEMTPEIEANAGETIRRANLLLDRFYQEVQTDYPQRGCNSGWRPTAINGSTPGAAVKSKHLLGLAIDIADPDGKLGEWVCSPAGKAALEEIGLWAEHRSATPSWCHVQTVPPRSGNRIFWP